LPGLLAGLFAVGQLEFNESEGLDDLYGITHEFWWEPLKPIATTAA
jgi:hypothetical protein